MVCVFAYTYRYTRTEISMCHADWNVIYYFLRLRYCVHVYHHAQVKQMSSKDLDHNSIN